MLLARAGASAGAQASDALIGQCRALATSMPLRQDGPTETEALGKDGCRFTGLRFGFGAHVSYGVVSPVEHGVPFGPLAAPTRAAQIRIEARGVAFAANTRNAKTNWLITQQQVPFDVVFDGSYDPAARRVDLRELSLESPSIGRVALSGTVEDVDTTDFPGSTSLRALNLLLDSRRFIVGFALSLLLPFLPDDHPDAAVGRGRREGIALARTLLPLAGASPSTVEAIAGFIADFPHPQHVFDLGVTATTPVTADTLEHATVGLTEAAALMRKLKVTASYAGEPR